MLPDLTNMLSWWQWALLAAVPVAIVLLYFLKLRRRPLAVPSTYLWRKSIEDLRVNALWQRLQRNPLLYLQLALLALIALALLRPSWQGMQLRGDRFVLLIDNSASMQATDQKPTRLDEAKRRAGELIDQMGSGDAAMIVSFSDTARVEQGFTDDRRRLRRSLAAIEPTARPTSLAEALRVVAGLVKAAQGVPPEAADSAEDSATAEEATPEVFLFSDGGFSPTDAMWLGEVRPTLVPIGSPDARNVAIVAFDVRRSDGARPRLQAYARLENFGPEPVDVLLELSRDGRLINADRVTIQPDEAQQVEFDLADVDTGAFRLRAAVEDDLALDNEAFAVVQPPQPANVLVLTPGNPPLAAALKTGTAAALAEVHFEQPAFLQSEAYRRQTLSGGYDLVIYDRCRPAEMPQSNTLFIGGLPPVEGWSAGVRVLGPTIIDVESTHPLLEWIELGEVLVAAATPLEVPPGGRVLIDSDTGPLMAVAPRQAFEDAVLGFPLVEQAGNARLAQESSDAAISSKKSGPDIRLNTNWPARPSFPAFVLNVLEYLGGRPEVGSEHLRPGQAVEFLAAGNGEPMQVVMPQGETVDLLPSGTMAAFVGTTGPGVYDLRQGPQIHHRFAVNLFDARESDVRADPLSGSRGGAYRLAGDSTWQTARREVWPLLVAGGLFLLLWEWYTYIKRVSL